MRPATKPRELATQPKPILRAELLGAEGQVLWVVELELAANDEPLTAARFGPLLAEAMRARARDIELELAQMPPSDPVGAELEAIWRLGRAAGLAGLERVRYRRRESSAWMELTLERKPLGEREPLG